MVVNNTDNCLNSRTSKAAQKWLQSEAADIVIIGSCQNLAAKAKSLFVKSPMSGLVLAKVILMIQQAIGPHENLLTIVKRRKLQWYGHVFPFIRSGQNHLARHSERGKKKRQTEEEIGRQQQEMDRPRVRQVREGSGEQGENYLWCPNDPRG